MDYRVGDTVLGGIVFYIKGGQEVGSHGLVVKRKLYREVYYPVELGLAGNNPATTSAAIITGQTNTMELWKTRILALTMIQTHVHEESHLEWDCCIPPWKKVTIRITAHDR